MSFRDTFNGDKDQLRLLKSKVHQKLWHRRQDPAESPLTPSASQSESSTLVDFCIDDRTYLADEQDAALESHDTRFLEFDNSAWATKRHGSPVIPPEVAYPTTREDRQTNAFTEYQMISPEDQAWTTPAWLSRDGKMQSRKRFTGLKRSTKVPNKMGIKPEFLDFEDRAWM